MKELLKFFLLAAACLVLAGCHRHDHEHDHHDGDNGHEKGHSHGDDAKSFSGATHKEGEGITLLPETKERLDIQVSDVQEAPLPSETTFTARVFASEDGGRLRASGIVPSAHATPFAEGARVKLESAGETFEGRVVRKSTPLSQDESEIVVDFASDKKSLSIGSFVRVTARSDTSEAVATVPKEALIRGANEAFVYVQNGDAFLRTIVEPGRETKEAIEIKEGLLEGDVVVSKGAMDLWLVELRAVKGGQGCCPAPPAKGKGK